MRPSRRPTGAGIPSVLVLTTALALAACEGGPSVAGIDVQIVGTDGRSPVASMDGTITVAVRHAGQLVECTSASCMTDVRGGTYELALPIGSFDGRTEIHVEVRGEGDRRWIGASPTFVPFGEGVDVVGGLRLVVGTPGGCQPLTLDGLATRERPRVAPARARVAAVRRRNLVLLAGGEDPTGGDDDHVDRFDQLLFDADTLATWDRSLDIGPAHGVALSEDVSLVVGTRSVRFVRDSVGPPLGREVTLEGASFLSAVVSLGANGAAVVAGAQSRAIHWVGSDGLLRGTTELAAARTRPAAALLSGGLLVLGGQEGEGPFAEWARALQPGSPLELDGDALPAGARGGYLVPSPDGRAALWIGWTVDGVPGAETYVVRRCPEACAVEAGPPWERARADVAATVTEAGALWLAGGQLDGAPSNLVDRVVWDGGQPHIEEGPLLDEARSESTAFEHASGIVMVVGGRGESGLLDSIEICLPSTLDPL